jgi:flavodoxin
MIKTGIVYATKTKHSKKLAEAIGTALNIKAENITSQPNLLDTDLLFIVGGIYGGESMPELIEYVRKLNPSMVKSVALVTNCCSGRQRQITVRKILDDNGIRVIDEFVCKGAILFVAFSHPNADDLIAAVGFAKSMKKHLNT